MKITFDNNNTNQNVDKVTTTTYRDTRTEKTGKTGAYALDISGTVMDNTAYKGQGKTAEDVMQEAGQIDIATQRDYMTVMSNTMSEEDFSRMVEDGYQVGDMDIEEVVTIVDKIKAELIKGGTQVAGYTDQIDAGTLREITGSEAFAQELSRQFAEHDIPLTEENVRDVMKAYARASTLEEVTEGAAKYMVENHMEPTIDNLYRAGHSASGDGSRQGRGYYTDGAGYYAKKAEEYDWNSLRPQIEKIITQAGLEVNEETLADARWLVEKGVPLTAEAVSDLYMLNQLAFPQDGRQVLAAIVSAVSDGKEAGAANLADGRSSMEKAAAYVERFARITDAAVDQVAAEGQELTLVNLEAAEERIETLKQPADENAAHYNRKDVSGSGGQHVQTGSGSVTATGENGADTVPVAENISARRQLEEIRLMMTIEANRKLLESGYAIDTTELEQLVNALRQIESQQNQALFGETDVARAAEKAALYTETRSKVAEIPFLPIDIAGRYKVTDQDFTLDQVHIDGTALRNQYDEAAKRYETWMTTTRTDLGDSIDKAFTNVDDKLEDLGMELNEENRRAVRILGYNRMELSKENIETVRESDAQLRRVIGKMTPTAVLQAIRDGKNPLELTLPELDEYLDSIPYTREQESEKYSKFLYKLDKNKAIDEQERTAYIGIYRMLRQFEKTDDAAVGALVSMGAEVSFKNMLSAVRSRKRSGMDFMVDDAFAGVEAIEKGMSISRQIESGFNKTYRDIVGNIADRMAKQDASTEKEYRQEQMQEMRQACEVEDAVIEELLQSKQPVTINNLAAADMLMNSRGTFYKKLKEYTTPADEEKVKDAVSRLHGALTDQEHAQEAFEEMEQVFEDVLEEAQYNADINYIDLKVIQSCRKQLTLAAGLAKEENYQIPVEINGETTAIHLRVLHSQQDGGKVKATLETESYGKTAAEFTIRNRKVSGYIACSTQEGTKSIQSRKDNLQKELQDTVESLAGNALELGDIGIVCSAELDLNAYTAEEVQDGSSVQTADLYQIAKAFITTITA